MRHIFKYWHQTGPWVGFTNQARQKLLRLHTEHTYVVATLVCFGLFFFPSCKHKRLLHNLPLTFEPRQWGSPQRLRCFLLAFPAPSLRLAPSISTSSMAGSLQMALNESERYQLPYEYSTKQLSYSAVLINDQYPAPLITVNKGDRLVINTHNKLSDPRMRRSVSIVHKKSFIYDSVLVGWYFFSALARALSSKDIWYGWSCFRKPMSHPTEYHLRLRFQCCPTNRKVSTQAFSDLTYHRADFP